MSPNSHPRLCPHSHTRTTCDRFAYYTSNFQHAGDYSVSDKGYYADGLFRPIYAKSKAIGDSLMRLMWNQASPVFFTTTLQGNYRGQATVGYMKGSPKEMVFTATSAAPTGAPIVYLQGSSSNGNNACFAGTFAPASQPSRPHYRLSCVPVSLYLVIDCHHPSHSL